MATTLPTVVRVGALSKLTPPFALRGMVSEFVVARGVKPVPLAPLPMVVAITLEVVLGLTRVRVPALALELAPGPIPAQALVRVQVQAREPVQIPEQAPEPARELALAQVLALAPGPVLADRVRAVGSRFRHRSRSHQSLMRMMTTIRLLAHRAITRRPQAACAFRTPRRPMVMANALRALCVSTGSVTALIRLPLEAAMEAVTVMAMEKAALVAPVWLVSPVKAMPSSAP